MKFLPADGATMQRMRILRPGLILCATIAMAAMFLSDHYGAPVMLLALLIGMSLNSIAPDGLFMPGVAYTSKTVLRIGVALLGARITMGEVVELGAIPVALAVIGVATTIGLGLVLARMLGKTSAFGVLTGGAVGICGASAAMALAAILPRGKHGIGEKDTIFAVIGVTTLSTVAMVTYPVLTSFLGFDDRSAGVFIGATVHDVAQVVGAGYTISPEAGDAATVTKLFRVMLLVPVVAAVTLALMRSGASGDGQRTRFPTFLIAFVLLVAINSIELVPGFVQWGLSEISRWALVAAIAGLGVRTSLKELLEVGPRSLVMIVAETAWIAALAVLILKL
ncbi:YeiH family protein [Pararhizobium haloflavum]|uniref:YeiH family protein n=1 Tax=Pararhizobium haloflavum TaxID=2037914 RepID=UPI000C18987E|nr:putative sulfate exporter family transporter [Pararhizobium haloflavum]